MGVFKFKELVDSSDDKTNVLVAGGIKLIVTNQIKELIVKKVGVVDWESLDGMDIKIIIKP